MGVDKIILEPGNGNDRPSKGDTVTIEYTGNLHESNTSDQFKRGSQCVHPGLHALGDGIDVL